MGFSSSFKIVSLTFAILLTVYLRMVSLRSSCLKFYFLDLDVYFLYQVREAFSHYSLNKVSFFFSLLLVESLYCKYLCAWYYPRGLLNYSHLKHFFFLLLFWFISSMWPSSCWFALLYWLICWWFLSRYFLLQLLYSSALLVYYTFSLLKFLCSTLVWWASL